MTTPDGPDTAASPSAGALADDFLRRQEAGERVNPYELILAHPECAGELEQLLAGAIEQYLAAQSHPLAEPPLAALPAAIGRYRIDTLLGSGSSSVVYRAYDPKFERHVALKVFRADPLTAPGSAGRFDRDARTLARLRHAHIVQLHETDEADGVRYIDMELVPGPSLEARLAGSSPPDFRAAAQLVWHVADALHHAHGRGVIHRDVKPSNILLDADGQAQLTDFGLARLVETDKSLTLPGVTLGTPEYMPPEQAAGRSHAADARSDVYSLGAVFYRLLTGRVPFEAGDSRTELLRRIETEDPTPPRRLRPDVPRDLETICLKALEKRPDDRFATAGAFAEELWRWLHDEPLTIRPPTWVERARRLVRRQSRAVRWLVTAAGGLLIAVAALALMLWDQRQRATVMTEANARIEAWGRLDLAWLRLRSPEMGRRFETQRMLREITGLRKLINDPREVERIDLEVRSLFALSLGVPDLRIDDWGQKEFTNAAEAQFLTWPTAIHPSGDWAVISTHDGPVRWNRGQPPPDISESGRPSDRPRVCFSPDGKYLSVAPATGGLALWDGAEIRHLKDLERPGVSPVLAVGYSATVDTVWAGFADGRVRSWSLKDFQAALDKRFAARAAWTAARFNPDAQLLAAGDANGRVSVFGRDGRLERELGNPEQRTTIVAFAWSPIDGRLLAIGAKDGSVELWNYEKDKLLRQFTPFGRAAGGIQFTPDGRWLLAGASKEGMQLWDVGTGELLLKVTGNCANVPFGVSQDGRWLATGDWALASFVELVIPDVVQHLRGHTAMVERLAWSRDGRTLASLDTRFQVRVWDVKQAKQLDAVPLPIPDQDFYAQNAAIALSDDGRYLAYASSGRSKAKALIYDIAAHTKLGEWPLPGGYEQLTPAGPGRFLLVREEIDPESRSVQTVVWQLEAGTEPRPLRVLRLGEPGDMGYFESGLTPDGELYGWSGPRRPSANYRVEVRRVTTGKMVKSVPLPLPEEIGHISVLVDPTGRFLWTGIRSDWRLYRLDSSQPHSKVAQFPVAVTAGGAWMVTSAQDTHRGTGAQLVAGGADRPWLLFPRDERNPGTISVFSPDGKYLACGSTAGPITVFNLDALKLEVAKFEAELRRDK